MDTIEKAREICRKLKLPEDGPARVVIADELEALIQQNAQLLEALKYIMNWTPDKWNPETARDLARAAISAVEIIK